MLLWYGFFEFSLIWDFFNAFCPSLLNCLPLVLILDKAPTAYLLSCLTTKFAEEYGSWYSLMKSEYFDLSKIPPSLPKEPSSIGYFFGFINEKNFPFVSNFGYLNEENNSHVSTVSVLICSRLFLISSICSCFGSFSQPPTVAETGCRSREPSSLIMPLPAFIIARALFSSLPYFGAIASALSYPR